MTSETASPLDRKTLGEEFAGAFDWWREAGVDCDFVDTAKDRLTEAADDRAALEEQAKPKQPDPVVTPEPRKFAPQSASTNESEKRLPERSAWPQKTGEFQQWWLGSEISQFGNGPCVPSRGKQDAALMVLVSQPEKVDRQLLLSGPQGKLLDGFLRAAGIAEENCYFASVLPAHIGLPDWDDLRSAGLGELTLHHISLTQPKRVLALGRSILPLLGHDQAQGSAQVTLSQGNAETVPVLGLPGLEELLRSAPRRKRMWQSWLEWSG